MERDERGKGAIWEADAHTLECQLLVVKKIVVNKKIHTLYSLAFNRPYAQLIKSMSYLFIFSGFFVSEVLEKHIFQVRLTDNYLLLELFPC